MDVIREYEPWELNSPVLPPTTRLYSLSPIGVGTPMVESLTGYIARLAEAHCVSTGLLYWKEIKALAGKGNIFSFRVTGDGGYSTHTINGHGSPAADFVRVMEVLTGRRDLRYLTLLTWAQVLPGHSLLRRWRAWCERCFQAWLQAKQPIYEPLLWTMHAVNLCPYHRCKLRDTCPYCARRIGPLDWRSRPGYCSRCEGALVGGDQTSSSQEPAGAELMWATWVATAFGELISAAPRIASPPTKDRLAHTPLKNYCKGLLLPGERKSMEPMAARLDPDNVQPMRQSLHHLVAKAPWSDEILLGEVRNHVLPAMQKQGPVVAWVIDDTGFPKKGTHSVGVARQYCGQVGKQDNCRVAVSLSMATWSSSLPIAYRLYLPKEWAEDFERREKAEVPKEVEFQTKPEIALDQIRAAVAANLDRGVVLADAAYGINTEFRDGVTELDLKYVVGVQSSMTVWEPGKQPLPAKPRGKMGRPPRLLQRSTEHQPVSVKQLAMNLPSAAFKEITWREGTDRKLQSRFAAVRMRAAHRDYEKAEPHQEEWLLIEWPRAEKEPAKYWVSTLPATTKLKALVKMAKHRWIIERDYEELKQELGLGHFEGRNWRGFHHHATLCIAAYGFLVAERNRFSPSARAGHLGFAALRQPPDFRPRGSPSTPRAP